MGVYPEEEFKRGNAVRGDEQVETLVSYYHVPGVTRVRVFEKVAEFEFRDDCFCCSCPDGGHDHACRNHGFYGRRPCEVHGMPGYAYDDSDEVPISVQAHRALRTADVGPPF